MKKISNTYESANPFFDTLTKEEIMREVTKAYGSPPKSQKPEKIDEIAIVNRKVIRKIIVLT
ncbi:4277_t:CDS:2 [Funneliformis geosporum]|uniref:4277_t:CDS:1 n=1 Tax=Funneliformis geosporum TaxID=1117311 RepID=A0A9W4SR43_9GLOM|nr:4277_t:CDS:2 [Funneliformis geosporum]